MPRHSPCDRVARNRRGPCSRRTERSPSSARLPAFPGNRRSRAQQRKTRDQARNPLHGHPPRDWSRWSMLLPLVLPKDSSAYAQARRQPLAAVSAVAVPRPLCGGGESRLPLRRIPVSLPVRQRAAGRRQRARRGRRSGAAQPARGRRREGRPRHRLPARPRRRIPRRRRARHRVREGRRLPAPERARRHCARRPGTRASARNPGREPALRRGQVQGSGADPADRAVQSAHDPGFFPATPRSRASR